MLYTRKGDDGTTSTFGCNQRLSKSSAIAEALGTLDEVNSFLGVIKTHKDAPSSLAETMNNVQHNLFIVQAEVAGSDKHITEEKVRELEAIINGIEKELPPIKNFFVSGGTELAALLDFSRTLARRAERRVVEVHEEKLRVIHKDTLAYLNRLSSLLYALARISNHKAGIAEQVPHY